eukprot:588808-Prorocentrum_lima.AAC.1
MCIRDSLSSTGCPIVASLWNTSPPNPTPASCTPVPPVGFPRLYRHALVHDRVTTPLHRPWSRSMPL